MVKPLKKSKSMTNKQLLLTLFLTNKQMITITSLMTKVQISIKPIYQIKT